MLGLIKVPTGGRRLPAHDGGGRILGGPDGFWKRDQEVAGYDTWYDTFSF